MIYSALSARYLVPLLIKLIYLRMVFFCVGFDTLSDTNMRKCSIDEHKRDATCEMSPRASMVFTLGPELTKK